jgi:hypothetical protein
VAWWGLAVFYDMGLTPWIFIDNYTARDETVARTGKKQHIRNPI